MKTQELISELQLITQQNIVFAQKLNGLPDTMLNWRNDAQSWSVLECLELLYLWSFLPS